MEKEIAMGERKGKDAGRVLDLERPGREIWEWRKLDGMENDIEGSWKGIAAWTRRGKENVK